MPARSKQPCPHPGCRALTDGGPCVKHRKAAEQQRGSAASRGYDRHWQKLRLVVLQEEPLCRHCAREGRVTVAEHVDHIDGDVRNMSRDNLQALCPPCHSRKTVREQGAFGL